MVGNVLSIGLGDGHGTGPWHSSEVPVWSIDSGLTSKTKENPGRRFYRCGVIFGENHVLKWANDAILEEIEALTIKQSAMEKDLIEIKEHVLDIKKDITEIVEVVAAFSTKLPKVAYRLNK